MYQEDFSNEAIILKNLKEFLAKYPIKTDGALKEHELFIDRKDDGDIYFIVTIPFWSHNSSVVRSVINLLQEFLRSEFIVRIYLRDNAAVVHVFVNICDPD